MLSSLPPCPVRSPLAFPVPGKAGCNFFLTAPFTSFAALSKQRVCEATPFSTYTSFPPAWQGPQIGPSTSASDLGVANGRWRRISCLQASLRNIDVDFGALGQSHLSDVPEGDGFTQTHPQSQRAGKSVFPVPFEKPWNVIVAAGRPPQLRNWHPDADSFLPPMILVAGVFTPKPVAGPHPAPGNLSESPPAKLLIVLHT